MTKILFIIAGYLCGSIPWGYILCRVFIKKDIRNYGSRNIGATNVYRVAGGFLALSVLVLDILKGFLPVFIAKSYFHFSSLFLICIGVACVVGHNFSCFLKGKGGKGVSTSFGVIIGLFPLAAFFSFIVWIAMVITTHYISVGSLCASLALPFFLHMCYKDPVYTSTGIIIFGLILYTHRENIKRVLQKKENSIRLPWEKK